MDLKIINIGKEHKKDILKLMEEINSFDDLSYSLTEEWLDYVIVNAGEGIFVAYLGDDLAGLGTAMLNSAYKDQASLNVVVSPRYRKRGIGGLIYDQVYKFAKSENIRMLEAYIKSRLDHAVRFAEKRGFSIGMYSWEMEMDLSGADLAYEKKEKQGFNFRKAELKDSDAYRRIILDAFGDEVGQDALAESLRDPSIIVYILEKDNEIIGSASVQIRKDLSLAYLYDIAIFKDYRGLGYGSYLLEAAVEDLKARAMDKAGLLVTGENKRALDLYKKTGFKEKDLDYVIYKEIIEK